MKDSLKKDRQRIEINESGCARVEIDIAYVTFKKNYIENIFDVFSNKHDEIPPVLRKSMKRFCDSKSIISTITNNSIWEDSFFT